MKGLCVIVLGIILICCCGFGYRFMQVDGATSALIALFVGGSTISSGVDMVRNSSNTPVTEEDEEDEED